MPHNGLKARRRFSTVRSTVGRDFDAKPRNSAQRTAKAKLRITYHRQCCAKQRNDAQLVRLELEIRCSIRVSYGRRIRTDIYRVFRRIKATGATRLLLLLFQDKIRSRIAKAPSTTVNNSAESTIYEGAGSRIRTDDLLITNQLLYQLSYAGVSPYESRFYRVHQELVTTRLWPDARKA